MNSTEQQQSSDFRAVERGDTFDEDTGAFLGQLSEITTETVHRFPVQIAVYLDGYYYIYKLDRKEKQE